MRQFFLAAVLIAVPVALFAGGELILTTASPPAPQDSAAPLGDLSALQAIVADVQKKAATGDMAAAGARVTDFETAWDAAESGMRPLNPPAWSAVDGAADAALRALRAANPDGATVEAALAALMAKLQYPLR